MKPDSRKDVEVGPVEAVTRPDADIPVLLAEPDPDRPKTTIRAWCPWCRRWHYHGAFLDGQVYAHKVAHCPHDGGSPLLKTGYYVKRQPEDGRR